MDELEENFYENNLSELTSRFEQMVKDGSNLYFEVDDLEHLLDHYVVHQRFDLGERVLSTAKMLHPTNKQLSIREAELLSLTNRYAEAINLLKDIELFESSNPDFYITKANVLSNHGNHAAAIESLTTALKICPEEDTAIYMNLAIEYQNIEDYRTAITYLKKAVSLEPENEDAIYELSYCFELAKDHDEAIATFNRLIDQAPYNKHAWFNLAAAYQAKGNLDKAVMAFDYALIIDENFHAAHFNKANAMAQLKRYEEAIELYKKALSFEILDTLIYFYIGDCYDSLGNHRNALTYFEKAIKKDDEMGEAWLAASSCLDMLGREQEALEYAKQAIMRDPENGEFHYFLAGLYSKYNLPDDALIEFENAVICEYLEEDLWIDYAQLSLSLGNNELAQSAIDRGLEIHHDCLMLKVYNSVLLFKNNREDEGFEQLAELLLVDPLLLEEFILFYPKGMEAEEIQYLIESLK